jgi:hypothetical protein
MRIWLKGMFFSEVGVFRVERSGFRLGEAPRSSKSELTLILVVEQGQVLGWSACGFALWRRDGQTEVVEDAADHVGVGNGGDDLQSSLAAGAF